MLYLTTRGGTDAHTANRTLIADRAGDGGLYIPMRLPQYDEAQIASLGKRGFGETVAEIINTFFPAQLTSWDVDVCIGRAPVKIASVGRRLMIAQMYHNPQKSYCYLENSLFTRICKNTAAGKPTNWAKIAIGIAVLFGIYGQMIRDDLLFHSDDFDIAVNTGDFSVPMSAWYARKMGLPVGKIICGSADSSEIWELIHRNQVNTAAMPEMLRLGLERIIRGIFGTAEVEKYARCCDSRGIYVISAEAVGNLSDDFFCAAVSNSRIPSVINSVYRTNRYFLDTGSAVPYGAVQDYRSKTGESCPTLLLASESPSSSAGAIMDATGIDAETFDEVCRNF